jgi:hypothetical protein
MAVIRDILSVLLALAAIGGLVYAIWLILDFMRGENDEKEE